jgi:signal peptidase I
MLRCRDRRVQAVERPKATDESSRAGPGGFRRTRRLMVLVLLSYLVVSASGLKGMLWPLRISESSMVPFVRGQGAVVRCPVCQRPFAIEPFDPSAADLRAVCARCGTLHQLTPPVHLSRGDRVLIQTRWHPPLSRLRWRAIAMRHPFRPDEWLAKRIVGLPGESIQLRDGDIYVNGRRQAKTLDEFRQLAIPVCDTRNPTQAGHKAAWARWQPASRPSAWRAEPDGYVSRPTSVDKWSWLAFRAADLAGRRPTDLLLLDDYPFNQSLSRRLHPVRDLLLRCELVDFREGAVACRVRVGGHTAKLVWDRAAGRAELSMDGHESRRSLAVPPSTSGASRVVWELAVCDGVLHFALDRRSLLTAPLPATMTRSNAVVDQLHIGARRAQLTLGQVELLRDIHYLALPSSAGSGRDGMSGPTILSSDEFFVLGDNSPVSDDSRHFGPVQSADLLGTLIRWPSPGRGANRTWRTDH